MKIESVELEGRSVRLEPLAEGHAEAFAEAAGPAEIWKYMPFQVTMADEAADWIEVAGRMLRSQIGLIFATILRDTGELVGSTGFLNPSPRDRRVEIGATWITPTRQRTAVNTEAKYLMLGHAFEAWGCARVEFKTDALNQKSRSALARIGATEEGTLRRHMMMPGGRIRDSVYFSVLDSEWPDVKQRLQALLER